MRWFKHMTDAHDDETMAELTDRFGLEGYGLWWRILEIIASKMDKNSDKCEATFPKKKWRNLCSIYRQSRFDLVTIFLASCKNPKLILSESSDNLLTIKCPNLLKFRDEYASRKSKNRDKLPTQSGQTPEQDTEYRIQNTDTENTKKTLARTHRKTNGSRPAIQNISSPEFVRISTNRNNEEFIVTESMVAEFQKLYPAIDVQQCIRSAKAWCIANPANRKTMVGMPRFINAWLSREQNKAGKADQQTNDPWRGVKVL